LYLAGKEKTPPWPNAILNVGTGAVHAVAFSPRNSFLACSIIAQYVIHVWDRHTGEQTQLEGHTNEITYLQYSFDGKYLASGSRDRAIRLWRGISESAAHSSSSDESMNRGTSSSRGAQQNQQSDIILLGHRSEITALAFSPTDSNLLASGCQAGEVKLWDVINQVCIYASDPQLSIITAIFFSPGDNIQCYAVGGHGKMIRIVSNNGIEFAATILEARYFRPAFSPCGTCFAATSYMGSGSGWELALFDLRTMVKTQSVVLPHGYAHFGSIAMSPDGKKLAITNDTGGIRVFECRDLTIQEYFIQQRQYDASAFVRWPVTFDPTSRFFAVGRNGGIAEIQAI
jgi:WD40 repeat protein